MKDSNYLPVYYSSFDTYIGFYQKVKINLLENCRRYKGSNRDHCSHFCLIFETTSKFLIVFVRLILGKVPLDLKVNLKDLGCQQRFLQPFLIELPSKNWICFFFLSDWYWGKLGLTEWSGHDGKVKSDINFILSPNQI